VDLRGRGHVLVIRVLMQDVVLDLVVRRKPQLAVRALTWTFVHGSIVRGSLPPYQGLGSHFERNGTPRRARVVSAGGGDLGPWFP
jgi:hypothetical protein